MEWFALLLPLLSCVIGMRFFFERFVWWEYILPLASTMFVILVLKLSVRTSLITDREYRGSMIVEAEYYEYWETWVKKTCSETYNCDCKRDKDGREVCQTCTRYYDCSECEKYPPMWIANDDNNNSWNISKEYYEYLRSKWNAKPEFVDMDRDIDDSHGCGEDGNMYRIKWDGKVESSEPAVVEEDYENRVQASHSSFNLPHIPESKAARLGLYKYPPIHDRYKQSVFLGLDSIVSPSENHRIEQKFQYFNGHYGPENKMKLFICLFYNKPLSISYDQEAYWNGGNQNELVVCIGLDTSGTLQWVRPFSWTDNKRVLVDCREDIMELKTFKPDSVYLAIEKAVDRSGDFHKSFKKDFSYLRVELPTWSLWLVWIISIAVTGAVWYWCFRNEYRQ